MSFFHLDHLLADATPSNLLGYWVGAGMLTLLVGVMLLLSKMSMNRRWAIGANLLTVGAGLILWPLVIGERLELVDSARLAALLGLGWSILISLLRWRCGERGRLHAQHVGIVVGQFLCLAACLFAILIHLYFMIWQLRESLSCTWSYAVLWPGERLFTDIDGLVDMALVVFAGILVTESTKSAYLMTPLFWVMYLGMIYQCLLIPPVVPETPGWATALMGYPSFWLLVWLMGSAVLLWVYVGLQWWSWRSSREQAWRLDVMYLLRAPRSWPGLISTTLTIGFFNLLLAITLLLFPAPAQGFRAIWPGLGCTLACGGSAVVVWLVAGRYRHTGLAEVGFGLMSVAVAALVVAVGGGGGVLLMDQFPNLLNSLLMGCAFCCVLWMWLARVWRQQLHAGYAWTTEGWMIPIAQRSSLMVGAIGCVLALRMSSWPLLAQSRSDDVGWGRIILGGMALLFLILATIYAYRQTRRPVFRSLITASVTGLLLFVFVRLLPFTPWHN
ncbi:MAG: hypothetical protein HJJLKODD_01955 [Phycisphaerae bacterium]|nr:hypothetical protein [Phycisphaerae bacterium]